MQNLVSRLGHYVTESTKVEYLRKSINPRYLKQLALETINNIADLVHNCKKIDETLTLSKKQQQVHKVAEIAANNSSTYISNNENSNAQYRVRYRQAANSNSNYYLEFV